MADGRHIVVYGEGNISVQPDRCILHAALNIMADTGPEAVTRCSGLARRVLARLQEAGLSPAKARTSNIAVHDWLDQATRQVTARVCTYELTVTVDDLDQVGAVMAAFVDTAGDSYQQRGLFLHVQDRTPLEASARLQAVRDAQRKAAELADAADVTLGELLEITDEHVPSFLGQRIAYPTAGLPAPPPAMPVAPGSLDITARVRLTYTFERSAR